MANTFDIYQNCQNELSLVFPLEMIGDITSRVLFYTFHVALINLNNSTLVLLHHYFRSNVGWSYLLGVKAGVRVLYHNDLKIIGTGCMRRNSHYNNMENF